MSVINNKKDRLKNKARINYIRASFKVDSESKTEHKNKYDAINFIVKVYAM
jgi:uncharacterized OsmC-like protein